jgi:hypothetical protein
MPVLTGTAEMQDLAQKLVKMKFNRAKAYLRHLDRKSKIEMFRDSVGYQEIHTRFALPTKGMRVTLIEKKEYVGPVLRHGFRRSKFTFLEARVEPLEDKANKNKSLLPMYSEE